MAIKADQIIALLEEQLKLLRTLQDAKQPIGGFCVVVPPDTPPITFINIGSQDDSMSFYKYLADKLTASQEQSGFGAVRTGR